MEPMLTRRSKSPASESQIGSAFMRGRNSRVAIAAHAMLLAACASDPPALPSSLYDDAALAELVDANDGIAGVAPRTSAFSEGEPVRYWHLGERSAQPMRAYVLYEEVEGERVRVDHPLVVDRIPGEEGYSPYLHLHWVRVPPGYAGRLRSFDEVDAAVASGAVSAPEPESSYLHCPIAAPDAELDLGGGMTALPETPIWVRGLEARCFDLSQGRPPRPLLSNGGMIIRHVYVLTREGEDAPLAEAARMEDLTGDGDQTDSNQVFGVSLHDGDYTPRWKMVTVTVPADYASIDTSGDENVADYRAATDMFDVAPDYTITPIEGRVVDYALTEVFIDCPIQSREGQL